MSIVCRLREQARQVGEGGREGQREVGGKEGDECAHQCALNGGSRRRCVCRHCLQIVGTARTAKEGEGSVG